MNQSLEDIPEITAIEIRKAMHKLKNSKSAGGDEIVVEAIRLGGNAW